MDSVPRPRDVKKVRRAGARMSAAISQSNACGRMPGATSAPYGASFALDPLQRGLKQMALVDAGGSTRLSTFTLGSRRSLACDEHVCFMEPRSVHERKSSPLVDVSLTLARKRRVNPSWHD